MTASIRVLLADDQALSRERLAVLLGAQPDIDVVGEAVGRADAVAQAAWLQPDVVLIDVRMPGLDRIAATVQLLSGSGATRVLVLTTEDEDEHVHAALRAGASGVVPKSASAVALAEAVRAVALSDTALVPSRTARLLADDTAHSLWSPADFGPRQRLTDLETEVLALLAQGLSDTEIATELAVTEQTVTTHMRRVLTKLDLRDRTQAAVYANVNDVTRRPLSP